MKQYKSNNSFTVIYFNKISILHNQEVRLYFIWKWFEYMQIAYSFNQELLKLIILY